MSSLFAAEMIFLIERSTAGLYAEYRYATSGLPLSMRDQCNRHRSTSPLRFPCAGPFPCTYHSIIISLFLQQVFGQKRRFFREFLQFPPKSAHYRHAPAVAAASAGAAAASFCPASSASPAAGSAVPSAGASAASAAVSGCASDSAAASSTVRVPSFIA